METVTIHILLSFPGQGRPTLTIARAEWEEAKKRASNGEQVALDGVFSGTLLIRPGHGTLLMTGPQRHGSWPAKDGMFGEVLLTDDPPASM
jgi:hypothetical protein